MALIDTHSIVEDLIAGGFAKSQAETLVRLKILHYEDLACKKDLENVESLIRRDLDTLDDKMDNMQTELMYVKKEIINVQHDLERRFDRIDNNFTWMKGIGVALLILGIKIAFFN